MQLLPQDVRQWGWFIFRCLGLIFLVLIGFIYPTSKDMPVNSLPQSVSSSNNLAILRHNLREHVYTLAGTIGERNVWQLQRYRAAADYIEEQWQTMGYTVNRQRYKAGGIEVANLEAMIPGQETAEEIIVIGAHYDSVIGSPGANDNATGVAALLELARWAYGMKFSRTVRFVAFANEEPPFFLTREMGSRIYAVCSRDHKENIIAMISLETIGCYSDFPGSQRYPFPFGFFYPDTANFIGFVANLRSRQLVRNIQQMFRRHSVFPSETVSAPGWMTGIGWSDHWSFWRQGYPAIMVTDTALFRYDYYHTVADTPDRIDYESMALVVEGLTGVVEDIGVSLDLPSAASP